LQPAGCHVRRLAGHLFTPADFLSKAWTYQRHFNFSRKDSYQRWRTPIQRLAEAAPQISPRVALLPPVHLDILLPAALKRHTSSLRHEMLSNLLDPSAHD